MEPDETRGTSIEKVVGSVRRYLGTTHDGLCGVRVVIVAVLRGLTPDERETLTDDAIIGAVRADDTIEFAPLTREDNLELPTGVAVIDPAPGFQSERGERASWVTSDAAPWDFEPPLCRRPDERP